MDDGMTLASGTMMTTLHFSLGDTLWFAGWVPQWIAAVRAMMEAQWRVAARAADAAVLAHDVMRGVMHGLQAMLGFVLMLAVMCVFSLSSFPLFLFPPWLRTSFILALVLGLGEALFGR
ncbi:CTR copper uptake transporter [Mycena latifolia]|nr:CTR copper uptake transporter [Mycena latifolia]